MNGKEIRFIDLFGGVGGFRLGLEKCNILHPGGCSDGKEASLHGRTTKTKEGDDTSAVGHRKIFRCVYYNDSDRQATAVYNKRFGESWRSTDIRGIRAKDIPDHEMLCGGFPCQAFSIAGKRKGFEDTRGTLFFEIARIAGAKRPKILFLENVKGLLSHDGGKTFEIILDTLDRLGYDAEWQVLNSKDFGVPQNRERVFIVGHLRGECWRGVFPLRGVDQKTPESATGGKIITIQKTNCGQANRVYHTGGLSPTLKAYGWKEPKISVQSILTFDREKKTRSKGRLNKTRRLTPLEYERLQGFPDGWTEGFSKTQRYKMMGNAVTVDVIEKIGEGIISALGFD